MIARIPFCYAMTHVLAGAVVAFFVGACCKCPAQHGPVDPPADSSTAAMACFKFRTFNCPEGDLPIAGGETCEQVAGRNDPRIAFDAKCVADANTVDELRRCPGATCRAR